MSTRRSLIAGAAALGALKLLPDVTLAEPRPVWLTMHTLVHDAEEWMMLHRAFFAWLTREAVVDDHGSTVVWGRVRDSLANSSLDRRQRWEPAIVQTVVHGACVPVKVLDDAVLNVFRAGFRAQATIRYEHTDRDSPVDWMAKQILLGREHRIYKSIGYSHEVSIDLS